MKFEHSRLFKDVQLSGMFSDSKVFSDAIPKQSWPVACAEYDKTQPADLETFVATHFEFAEAPELQALNDVRTVPDYIERLWDRLARQGSEQNTSSLLALPKPYIVPGGRFNEIYYWDSYFTALGLMDSGRGKLVEDMLENFCSLIESLGHVPNGNRSYYATRSQPPVTAMMVDLLWETKKDDENWLTSVTSSLQREYDFWMKGSDKLSSDLLHFDRVVMMPCGGILNRYWDNDPSPRPESYKEDIEDAEHFTNDEKAHFYRNIRAACESGWDFSSRWLQEPDNLKTIITTHIAPVDLNALLYFLETQLSRCYQATSNSKESHRMERAAKRRAALINQYMWDEQANWYVDFDIELNCKRNIVTMAGATALFFNLVEDCARAHQVSQKMMSDFCKAGGLVTTLAATPQQWDSPNGWAPLQWFGVKGLLNYGFTQEAKEVASKWLKTLESSFEVNQCLLEKYNVIEPNKKAEGGEYIVQQGFGWTNGVASRFYTLFGKSE
ncbi:trehalase family glycosidase [Pseudoalteromonas luteoviolacea]|uniref:trehalase family glycosidase n=1 Tax=Pseudoalteromonas luteoviolacea TaxID=43657 RepID=UPI001B35EF82|nr:trehalase family glycosidase [Pseudoalteromonas luteoviolacea]MBQ4834982.1 alpha,alpha-trehalase [Pseudoalteromonas luteoviolacea]